MLHQCLFRYNPYYVHNRRDLAQADLIDISRIKNANDGIRFLLLIIDLFSKRVWLYPLRSKSAADMVVAMRSWINSLDTPFRICQTDRGLEFRCAPVQALLQDAGIEWQPADGTMKAAVAERANKTIQILIYKYLSENETLRYIDVLSRLVDTYNKRMHRSLDGMAPFTADIPENEILVQQVHHARYGKLGAFRKAPKFKVGDVVKVKILAHKISQNSRAYAEQFSGEYFRVARINRSLPFPLYFLKSLDTQENIVGGFYAEELQRVRGSVFKVEAILDERTRRGVREVLIKWKNFGPRWNSWEPRRNITRTF